MSKEILCAMMENIICYDNPGWEECCNQILERYQGKITEKRYTNLYKYRNGEIYVESIKGRRSDFADILEFWIAAIVIIYDEDSWNFRLDYIEEALCRPIGPEEVISHIEYCNNYIRTAIPFNKEKSIKSAMKMYDVWNNIEIIWEDEEEYTLLTWSTSA